MTGRTSLVPFKNAGALALHPGSLGNLDAYITAVNQVPLLTQEEEEQLILRLAVVYQGVIFQNAALPSFGEPTRAGRQRLIHELVPLERPRIGVEIGLRVTGFPR